MSKLHYPQFCALARAAEIIGERWTLLIVRELLLGPQRFNHLAERLAPITPAMLTNRLKALIEFGVVQRSELPAPYDVRVYELTAVGQDLRLAFHELIRWGGQFLFPMRKDDTFDPDWTLLALEAIARKGRTARLTIGLRIMHDSKSGSLVLEGTGKGTRVRKGHAPADVLIETRFEILLQTIAGTLSVDDGVKRGALRVEGNMATARRLPELFDLRPSSG